MKLLILSVLLSTAWAAPAAQSMTFQDDGSYRFYYETGREGGSHSRSEVRNPDGVVIGRFSYADPEGQLREVNYRADEFGFVAEGDVSVNGAPKGQFPVPQDELLPEEADHSLEEQGESEQFESTTETSELPAEPKEPQPKSEDVPIETHPDEEDKNEMQDLTLEESSSSDDPPEAFPPGFFLEKFHGLRRLPEPTKEDTPSTESPKETEKQNSEEIQDKKDSEGSPVPEKKIIPEPGIFPPLRPFPSYSPRDWAAAMFHQPVYVFAYQQPDSYGYHYFF